VVLVKLRESVLAALKRGYVAGPSGELAHREVWKREGTYPLHRGWVVHHIDCNKKNNDISNLIALPQGLHHAIHVEMRAKGITYSKFELLLRVRPFLEKHAERIKNKSGWLFRNTYVRRCEQQFVDYDYIKKLSSSDYAWLEKFTRGFYVCDFRDWEWSVAEKRSATRANNAYRRDVWNFRERVEVELDEIPDTPSAQFIPRLRRA
jgi:hypothetical protein